jgi:hypothetical protein
MKIGFLFLCLAISIGLYQGWFARAYDHLTSVALSEDARTAIEVRCGVDDDSAARECRAMLKRLYLSGSLDPDKTLRAWCDSVKTSRWGGGYAKPPRLCVRRYGGWTGS